MSTPTLLLRTLLFGCGLLFIAGCETMHWPQSWSTGKTGARKFSDADGYRQQWQTRRDGRAVRWLLAHQIRNGQTLDDVDTRLGETGVREENSQQFKKDATGYRLDDELYGYGPDSQGHVYYLAFRDGRLVNFDPAEFKN